MDDDPLFIPGWWYNKPEINEKEYLDDTLESFL